MNNNCQVIPVRFQSGFTFDTDNDCNLVSNDVYDYTSTPYLNIDKITYNTVSGVQGSLRICKYNLDESFVDSEYLLYYAGNQSSYTKELDQNYLYRFSIREGKFENFKAYNCNREISSMANRLAFGSGNSLFTNLADLAPLFIVIIGFALGFWFLKRIVNKGQQGKTL